MRADTRLLDQLLVNTDKVTQKELKDFVLQQSVNLDITYPRETLKLPSIVIVLKSESEANAYLGDSKGLNEIPDEISYDTFEDSDIEILGGGSPPTGLAGQGKLVYGPAQVSGATNNTLRIATRVWDIDQFRTADYVVNILQGTGKGQTRAISANGQNNLMVSINWTTTPDATSVFEIRAVPDEIIGEPTTVFARENAYKTEKLGWLHQMSYQIQIITQNPELTIFLHAIVKSILLLGRVFLERNGIINFSLSATDFVNKPEYQPDHAYIRAMTMEFMYPFDVFSEMTGLAESFNVILEQNIEEPDNEQIILIEGVTEES